MGSASSLTVAKEQLSLIGNYDQETKSLWQRLMTSLNDAGVLELTPDVMQADMAVRAYQRYLQLDQVEYDVMHNLLNTQDASISDFQKEQQGKLDEFLRIGRIDAKGYAACMNALVEACNARHANLHNLLSVVNKAKFQNGQFFNKASALAAFSRVARKEHGSGSGHEMEQLAKTLKDERDELNLSERGASISVVNIPGTTDAEFSEVDQAVHDGMLDQIRQPISGIGEEQ